MHEIRISLFRSCVGQVTCWTCWDRNTTRSITSNLPLKTTNASIDNWVKNLYANDARLRWIPSVDFEERFQRRHRIFCYIILLTKRIESIGGQYGNVFYKNNWFCSIKLLPVYGSCVDRVFLFNNNYLPFSAYKQRALNIENLTEFKRISTVYICRLFSFCLNIIYTTVFEFIPEIRTLENVRFVHISDFRHWFYFIHMWRFSCLIA